MCKYVKLSSTNKPGKVRNMKDNQLFASPIASSPANEESEVQAPSRCSSINETTLPSMKLLFPEQHLKWHRDFFRPPNQDTYHEIALILIANIVIYTVWKGHCQYYIQDTIQVIIATCSCGQELAGNTSIVLKAMIRN